MGPRLVFDTYDDIRGRCDTAPVRQTGSEPGHDQGAIVPGDDWVPLTAEEAERHQADDSTPDSIRIELVRRPLPPLDPDDLSGRLETAARLAPLNGCWPTELLVPQSRPTGIPDLGDEYSSGAPQSKRYIRPGPSALDVTNCHDATPIRRMAPGQTALTWHPPSIPVAAQPGRDPLPNAVAED
ncbi:hypothetical protein ACFV9P_21900 [Streptomyces sp. NPDC059892]|uniref:hypothetical protein n=1 Tax=Streptomyces sp. NPDC059892 TaxID=3346989 RepID=UPI00365948C5